MPLRPRLFALCALALIATGRGGAYQSPDFSVELFSRDGIFLEPSERSRLLGALTALASNFSGQAGVDDDLREKALALALCLDPLAPASRAAHRHLLAGQEPPPTDSIHQLEEISEALWSIAETLAADPPDPEEHGLARFLFEVSLLLQAQPPAERLVAFARTCRGEAPEWEPAVRLERESNPSTARARDLYRDALAALRESRAERRTMAEASNPAPAPLPEPGVPVPPPRRPAAVAIEPVSVSLATVRWVVGEASVAVPGTATLVIRSPVNGQERTWLAERRGSETSLPLRASAEGLPLEIPDPAPQGFTEVSSTWPEGALGELSFTPASSLPGPRRQFRPTAQLPAKVLLKAALEKKVLNDSFVLLGELDPASGEWVLPGDAVAVVEAALTLNRPYLLLPAVALEPLVAALQRSERLELLFKSEWISAADLPAALDRMTQPTDPILTVASGDFDRIEAASASMPLPELARLPSAQERLQGILDAFPDHLSARVMLEIGKRPISPEVRLARTVAQIDAIVAPFLGLELGGEGFTGQAGADFFDGISTRFLKMRTEIPAEARGLLGAAEDLVEAGEAYLQLTNRETSIGSQRLREARAAIAAFKSERAPFEPAPAE